MKRRLFVLVCLVFSLFVAGAALPSQDLTKDMVAADVQRYFANPNPGFAFSQSITDAGELTALLNTFFKDNFLYVDYMSRESQDYRGTLLNSVCSFLESQGRRVSDFKVQPKKVVSMHDLKVIAVRNVFPLRLTPEGKIGTLICASAMGFKDFANRDVPVEAFAFQAIFNEIKKKESFVLAKVHEYAELARSLKLSTSPEDLVKRAQGAFWVLLYQNADFEKLLSDAYQEKAKILPFEIQAK